jgi:hypothetical protein
MTICDRSCQPRHECSEEYGREGQAERKRLLIKSITINIQAFTLDPSLLLTQFVAKFTLSAEFRKTMMSIKIIRWIGYLRDSACELFLIPRII